MKARIFGGLFLVMLLVPFSGCPPVEPIIDGVWLFTVDGVIVGVNLVANGTAFPSNPPEADTSFVGTMKWMQRGSRFTMTQLSNGTPLAEYTGRVATSTSIINGTWVNASGQKVGTWVGEKL